MAQQVVTPQVSGLYLDLENISPNNVLGTSQQVGGLFVQGGFDCAVSYPGTCISGSGPVGGYQTVIYNSSTLTIGNGSTYTPFEQVTLNAPTYSATLATNTNSFGYPAAFAGSPAAPLVYANGGDQVGFTLATSSVYYNVSGTFSNGASFPDLVGSPTATPNWEFNVYNSASGTYPALNVTQFLTTSVNCNGAFQSVNLLNCNGVLAPIIPFPQNVNFTLSTQANNVITPTFFWAQPAGYTPDILRMEIWQINGSGVAATNIFSVTLAGNATSYTVPLTFTNLTTGQPGSLVVGQEYAIDIENVTLRNAGAQIGTNDNIWSRSRSFFDFTPETSATSLPAGTPIQIPVVNNTTGTTTYVFNESVTAGTTAYIDPAVATGYLYQSGAGNPNFTSVTPITSIGSGVYQLYTQGAGGVYVFSATISAGQTYTFSGSGVSSFEITGIPASANVDPSNTSAFITGLTFSASGQFTGTMTPLTGSAAGDGGGTDGPIPLWALGTLGAALIGVASRRSKKAA